MDILVPDEFLQFGVHFVPLLIVEVEAGGRSFVHLPPVHEFVLCPTPPHPAAVTG